MSESIRAFQPNRTIYMRGFDLRGAAAFLHSDTEDSFVCSGTFNDFADFVVIVLFDADNIFEHHTIRYLPTFDLSNVVLKFVLTYNNEIQGIDSTKSQWIPWGNLSYVKADGSSGTISLLDNATLFSGNYTPASATWTLTGTPNTFDHITFWYRDTPFDVLLFAPDTITNVRDNLKAQINGYNWWVEQPSIAIRATSTSTDDLTIEAATYGRCNVNGTIVTWTAGPRKFAGLSGSIRINGTDYTISTVVSPKQLTLTTSAGTQTDVLYTAALGGVDGNDINIQCRSKNAGLTTSGSVLLGGYLDESKNLGTGNSDVSWLVSLDFTALAIDSLRQCWLTLAPKYSASGFSRSEFDAEFSQISVIDPDGNTRLTFPDARKSIRVGVHDRWAVFSGSWVEETGFWFQGYARASDVLDDTVTVTYHCQYTHDVYLNTYLYVDQGKYAASIDGGVESTFDNFLQTPTGIRTRRVLFTGVAAGKHTVVLRVKHEKHASSSGYRVYFDCLDAIVVSQTVSDPEFSYEDFVPAIDLDTDRTYKVPVCRLIWAYRQMGYAGDINNYLGVFHLFQRYREGGTDSEYQIQFVPNAGFAVGDTVSIVLSGITINRTLQILDIDAGDITVAPKILASSLRGILNSQFPGIYATAIDDKLYIKPSTWKFTFTISSSVTSAAGTIATTGSLALGTEGTWILDAYSTGTKLNYATTKWLEAYCKELALRGLTTTIAISMELVNPPEAPGSPWASRFADGTPITTATSFGNLSSTHCAFNFIVLDFQVRVFLEIAKIQNDAKLPVKIQCGEYIWWFFTGGSPASLGFYDHNTKLDFLLETGNPLHVFTNQNEATGTHSADLQFLRDRLKWYIAYLQVAVKEEYPDALIELLFPTDVTHPTSYQNIQWPYPQGGNINYNASWHPDFGVPSLAPFDILKIECLSWGVSYHNLDLIKIGLRFPFTGPNVWPRSKVKYLAPAFGQGTPRKLEYDAAAKEVSIVNMFAIDHLDLLSLKLKKP